MTDVLLPILVARDVQLTIAWFVVSVQQKYGSFAFAPRESKTCKFMIRIAGSLGLPQKKC